MWKGSALVRFALLLSIGLLSFATLHPALADENAEPNGAVPGLMPSMMELQFAARMEGKTLFQLGADLVRQGQAALIAQAPIAQGIAKGMEVVAGDPDESNTWRFKGLEREIGPIRSHLTTLINKILVENKPTAAQAKGLVEWFALFTTADMRCKEQPSIKNLDAITTVLLNATPAFRAFDQPEIRLLETILSTVRLEKHVRMISDYYSTILETFKNNPHRLEDNYLKIDKLTLNPQAALAGNENAISGFKEQYGTWLALWALELKPYAEPNAPLLKGHQAEVAKIVADTERINSELAKGLWETQDQISTLIEDIQRLLAKEEAFAPVALRIEAGILFNYEMNLFATMRDGAALARGLKRNSLEATVGNVTYLLDLSVNPPQIKFSDPKNEFLDKIKRVNQLAQNTLKRSQLGPSDRIILETAIASLTDSEKAIANMTSHADWVKWLHAINEIHKLYKF